MSKFCYCEVTDTIRTQPENYLVLSRDVGQFSSRWNIGDCDAALPLKAYLHVAKLLHTNHDVKYGTQWTVLTRLTPFKF